MTISNSKISIFQRCAEGNAVNLMDFWTAAQEARVRIIGRHGIVKFEMDGCSASTPRTAETVGGNNRGGEDFTNLSKNIIRSLDA